MEVVISGGKNQGGGLEGARMERCRPGGCSRTEHAAARQSCGEGRTDRQTERDGQKAGMNGHLP